LNDDDNEIKKNLKPIDINFYCYYLTLPLCWLASDFAVGDRVPAGDHFVGLIVNEKVREWFSSGTNHDAGATD
jgi:hypothetical protein